MIDLGVIDNPAPVDDELVQFTIAYQRKIEADGDQPVTMQSESAAFTAHGVLPYGSVLAYMGASANPNLAAQSAALLRFLHAALPEPDRIRIDELIDDPTVQIQASTLMTIAARLCIHYTTPRLDPMSAAGGGKPKKSAGGSKATQRGSSGRARAKASD